MNTPEDKKVFLMIEPFDCDHYPRDNPLPEYEITDIKVVIPKNEQIH